MTASRKPSEAPWPTNALPPTTTIRRRDSDFERAVDLLRSRGERVHVVTARRVISRELVYVADKPVFFVEEFRQDLERDAKPDPIAAPPA
jgi:uncharacterized LabA/DUF88 family protein